MPMFRERRRRPAIRTLRGWAVSVLQEAGAIQECESTAGCRTAPIRMRERALDIASRHPPARVSRDEAIAEIEEVLTLIGATCPECPPEVS
jgi:hypothetical protein